jgi:hypothetical protein
MLSSISKAIKKNQLTWEIHATGMFSANVQVNVPY